jgi:pimeloyl-ACP methyl ester carboxylesterase
VIVFVHGVPETAQLWDKLRSEIDADSIAVSLPGFGCERPAGFGATKDDYAEWLADELKGIDGPIDIVGHDWGAGLTYRVATTRGELMRSWAVDAAGGAHPDYEWHDFAKIWQTPGEGEAFFEGQLAQSEEEGAQVFETFGVPRDDALAMFSRIDKTMTDCILDLYRSATPNIYADWGEAFKPTKAPGLVLIATEDPFVGDVGRSEEVAEMLGARVEHLEGLGHWWCLQDPKRAAGALQRFWDSLS